MHSSLLSSRRHQPTTKMVPVTNLARGIPGTKMTCLTYFQSESDSDNDLPSYTTSYLSLSFFLSSHLADMLVLGGTSFCGFFLGFTCRLHPSSFILSLSLSLHSSPFVNQGHSTEAKRRTMKAGWFLCGLFFSYLFVCGSATSTQPTLSKMMHPTYPRRSSSTGSQRQRARTRSPIGTPPQ